MLHKTGALLLCSRENNQKNLGGIIMKKAIAVLCLAAMMLTSCTDVPDTVKDRAENSSVTESMESKADSDLVFDTVENVTKNAASVLGNKYQNIVLPKSIDIPIASEAYTFSASRETDDADVSALLDEFTMDYVGEKPEIVHPSGIIPKGFDAAISRRLGLEPSYEEPDPEEQQPDIDPKYCLVADGIDRYHIEMYSSRTIFAYLFSDWHYSYLSDYSSAVYDLASDSIDGISYKVAEQDYPIDEAVSYAEEFMHDTLMKYLINDDAVKPEKVYVFDLKNDNKAYYISLRHYIGDLPVSSSGEGEMMQPHMAGCELYLAVEEPGKIGKISNSRYFSVSDKQKIDKLITLESAIAHAESVLAPFEVYKVKKISLEYCAREDSCGKQSGYEYHPMWCLTLWESDQHNPYFLEQRKILYVDAVTGAVMLWDDAQHQMIFEKQ